MFAQVFLFIRIHFIKHDFSLILFSQFFHFRKQSHARAAPSCPKVNNHRFVSIINENIFGQELNVPAMHAYVKAYLANQRQGTQSVKTRAIVLENVFM